MMGKYKEYLRMVKKR